MIDLKISRKGLWKLKNTKNKVPISDIGYILMISIDIDGIEIIEIYSISSLGTTFFVFFSTKRVD